MHIQQLSVSHDDRQDRILLRLNTQDSQEFHFWLTRRMVARLLPAMGHWLVKLEATQPGVAASNTHSQRILTEIKREAFLQHADFTTPYTSEPGPCPLGSEPLLVTDVQLSLHPKGSLQVVFQEKNGNSEQSCHLNLQAPLVHGLIHLVHQTLAKTEWGLTDAVQLDVPTPELLADIHSAPYKH
ncbi:hypothetical protein [Limnohabitans sp.]|jgi:hypothetical protein|uniref:hypothetical protein n=1 Tax=Limnohabitans sp. TaxID=1907725 RepID=UPI0039BCEE72|nr:hypothetical protein [Comamonadaceae bacterium]